MERCLILSARRYDFKDERGRQVEGVTLHYVTGERVSDEDRRGIEPLTVSGPLELFPQLRELPGVYEMAFKQRPGKNGRPTLQLASVKLLRAVDVAAAIAQVQPERA